jgi:copper chaperone
MISFQIPAMSCGHCVRSITEAVLATDPAAQVQADLASHSVQITSSTPPEALAAALAAAGYAPAPAT